MFSINHNFDQIFCPKAALVIYEAVCDQETSFVEAYDFDAKGRPINAQPLSNDDCVALANSLASSKELSTSFLRCNGLLPTNLLHLDTGLQGYAIWYTEPCRQALKFVSGLDIPSVEMPIPALIWKADKKQLSLYAVKLKNKERPALDTPLQHAPFFNIYRNGVVCMGTVSIDIPQDCDLDKFIALWQSYFFNSYFSHAMGDHVPIKGNIIQAWQHLAKSLNDFPNKLLTNTNRTLKDLL